MILLAALPLPLELLVVPPSLWFSFPDPGTQRGLRFPCFDRASEVVEDVAVGESERWLEAVVLLRLMLFLRGNAISDPAEERERRSS